MKTLRDLDDSVLVVACEMFLSGDKAVAIRDEVNERIGKLGHDYEITRERVYPLLGLARERGFLHFAPPEDVLLTRRIADFYHLEEDQIHVANSGALDHVAASAATLLVDLIVAAGRKKDNVHVGLGGGYTSRLVAKHLAVGLRGVEHLPKLTLHALSSGFDPRNPNTAPVTFFGFFDRIGIDVDFVGLFSPPVVATADYPTTIKLHGVKESFAAKDDLDIVVTSLGSASHDHGDFNKFIDLGGKRSRAILTKAGWVGDVQYRPYSREGPIMVDAKIRSVTLLELHELVTMAADPDKHVVVVGGPCGRCTASRADALRPLLESPNLKVWSHFVMDVGTASELLRPPKAEA
jgi:hypothetical protein